LKRGTGLIPTAYNRLHSFIPSSVIKFYGFLPSYFQTLEDYKKYTSRLQLAMTDKTHNLITTIRRSGVIDHGQSWQAEGSSWISCGLPTYKNSLAGNH
jgi:hypothetical protein